MPGLRREITVLPIFRHLLTARRHPLRANARQPRFWDSKKCWEAEIMTRRRPNSLDTSVGFRRIGISAALMISTLCNFPRPLSIHFA
jgi:hypothetical protein